MWYGFLTLKKKSSLGDCVGCVPDERCNLVADKEVEEECDPLTDLIESVVSNNFFA